MKLTNAMESGVKRLLTRVRSVSATGEETCWCPLCRADIMALALSILPPRYATRRTGDVEADAHLAQSLNAAVARSVRHVGCFPKHPSGGGIAAGEPVWIVNFPLEECFRVIEPLIRSREVACECWQCRCDMVAFALNRYPPRYGVELDGRTHMRESDREQMRAELVPFLELAVEIVSKIPRHELPTATV
jgi:competence protein ComFB